MKQGVAFYPPDFLIVGVPWQGGVMLIVSTNITHAQLEVEQRQLFEFDGLFGGFAPDCHLTARMTRFTMITAPTYEEAWQKLMKTWKPPAQPGRQAIERGQQAIEG